MAKPFASSADLAAKQQTLEVLADGVYALTAEGDPNIGAIEGEDFVVCFEALATPGRRPLAGHAARAHRQAGALPGAVALPRGPGARRVRVRRRGDRRPREHPGAGGRARQAGLGQRVRPDAAAGRGRRLGARADLADAHLLRPADHRPRRGRRRATWSCSTAGAGTPRATSWPGCRGNGSCSPGTWSRPRPRSTPATRSTATGPAAPWTGWQALGAQTLVGGRGGVSRGPDAVAAAIAQTRGFLDVLLAEVGAVHAARRHAEGGVRGRARRAGRRLRAGGRSSSTACRSTSPGCGTSCPASSAR